MKKRILSIILALSLMFSLAAVRGITASAESFTSGDFECELLDDGTVGITGYNGSSETFDIPSTIDGKTVSRIQMGAFDDTAYYNNKSNWENGVLYIGNCLISGKLMAYDEELHEYYVITEAKDDYTVKDGTRIIADDAFAGCLFLTSVTIPDSVTSVGFMAFDGCRSLTDINVSADNKHFCSQDGVLFNKDKTEIIRHPAGKRAVRYIIPNSVTTICNNAFAYCDSLESVTLPNGITTIGEDAFFSCESLNGITFPDSVKSIGDSAFYSCDSLESVTLPDSVTYVGEYAFSHCDSLISATIPDSVTFIGWYAFSRCYLLKSVTIGDNVTEFGGNVFDKTALYYNEKNWKDGVLYVGNYLVSGKLTSFDDETYDEKVITEVKGDYKVKDGTKVIADTAFENCTLLTSITIPDSLITIGEYAFNGCTALTDITIPNSVISIGSYAFDWCSSMTSVTIPESVTHIGWRAFGYYLDYETFEEKKMSDFHIYCHRGTDAERYAFENDIEYTLLKRPNADYGDANCDGNIDMLDVLLIRKYIAKQPVTIDFTVSDVTCDNSVDMLDVLLIRKYIAKQPVHLGPQA